MRNLIAVSIFAALALLLALSAASGTVVGSAATSIGACPNMPDGSTVTLACVQVLWRGKSGKTFDVRSWTDDEGNPSPTLFVVSDQPMPVESYWSVDITGVLDTITTASSDGTIMTERVLRTDPSNVFVYCSSDGQPCPMGFPGLADLMSKRTLADLMEDTLVSFSMARNVITDESVSRSEQEDSPPSGEPVPCDTITDAKALDDGTFVHIECKPVLSVSTDHFTMAEDPESSPSDIVDVFWTNSPVEEDRVNILNGTVKTFNSAKVICVDRTPDGDDPENPIWSTDTDQVGRVQVCDDYSIPHVRTWPNGTSVEIRGVVVTANQTNFPGALYVEQPTRSAGTRVLYTGSYQPSRGTTVDVIGTISTASDGERIINAGTSGVQASATQQDVPGVLGLVQKSLGGGDFNSWTPGVSSPAGSGVGLYNKGLLVRTCGKVTAVDTATPPLFFYFDDGSNLVDESGNAGIKVSWEWATSGKPSIVPPNVGWYVSIAGICSSDTSDGGTTYYRVLRPRDQSDVGLFQPGDTTNPVVSITNPADNQVFVASGASSVSIAGEASDADTMVVAVDVKVGAGQWQAATYDSASHNWSFVWQNPQAAVITARATDFAGNSATVSREVAIVSYATSWLTMSAYTTRPDEVQASWTYPNTVNTLKYAVGTAPCRDDVCPWTATESPTATQATVSGLDLEDNTTYYFSLKGLDANGDLDHIGSCSFVTDFGADVISLVASPSVTRQTGDSVTVTATLTDCRGNAIAGRNLTFETTGAYDSTTTCTTDANGRASRTFSCSTEGFVNVAAHEYQPALANVEESIDIEFKKPPLIEVLFLIERNSYWDITYADHVRDTIWNYGGLLDLSYYSGVPIKFGGLAFDDLPCTHSHPFTDDYFEINDWLWGLYDNPCSLCNRNAVAWEALGGLAQASGMFDQAATQKYIAVVSNYKYLRCGEDPSAWYDYCFTPGGCYDKPTVVQMLEDAGCKVFVDPCSQTGTTYNDLAVNGAVEDGTSWPFPKMLDSIEGDIDEILDPTPPQYDSGTCDPLYVDPGDEEMGAMAPMAAMTINMSSASVVPVLISTNGDLEPSASSRYPCYSSDSNLGQHQDRQISVKFNLQAKRKYRFIVRDVPDESPYTNRHSRNAMGDNYPIGEGDYGTLDCTSDANHEHHGRVVYATTDAQGKVTLKLTITDRYAGNNYRVDVTPTSNANQILAQSPVIVAWKRIYLETDKMYKQPGLHQDQAAQNDPTSDVVGLALAGLRKVYVANLLNLSPYQQVMIFDADHPEGEHHTVSAVEGDAGGYYIELDSPLQQTYRGGYGENDRGAAVVKSDAEVLSYDVTSRLKEAYGDIADPSGATKPGCFVTFRLCPSGNNYVPFRKLDSRDKRSAFAKVWFQNRGKRNAIHLPLVASMETMGMSLIDENWSYIAYDQASMANTASDLSATAAHELCHQFFPYGGTDGDHKDVRSWSGRYGERCLMSTEKEMPVGRNEAINYSWEMPAHFCWAGDNHIMKIRSAPDDLSE